jgi:hypothetical protein
VAPHHQERQRRQARNYQAHAILNYSVGDGAEQSSRRSSDSGCEAVLRHAGGAEGEKGDWRSTRERGRPFSRSHRHHEKSSAAAEILPPLEELRELPLLRTSELDRRGTGIVR